MRGAWMFPLCDPRAEKGRAQVPGQLKLGAPMLRTRHPNQREGSVPGDSEPGNTNRTQHGTVRAPRTSAAGLHQPARPGSLPHPAGSRHSPAPPSWGHGAGGN